jgi:hypothetical protein
MVKDLLARDHLEADAGKALCHAHADETRVVLALPPQRSEFCKIVITWNQVVGGKEKGTLINSPSEVGKCLPCRFS